MKKNGSRNQELSDGLGVNSVLIQETILSLSEVVAVLRSINPRDEESLQENIEIAIPNEGLDFYNTTKYFEISIIKQALRKTRGHQTKAAKLLNLKLSTLNAIIKRHEISF